MHRFADACNVYRECTSRTRSSRTSRISTRQGLLRGKEDDLASSQELSLLAAATLHLRRGGKDPFLLGVGADKQSVEGEFSWAGYRFTEFFEVHLWSAERWSVIRVMSSSCSQLGSEGGQLFYQEFHQQPLLAVVG